MNLILQAIKSMFRNIEQQIAKLYKKTEDLQTLSEIKPDWNQNDESSPAYIANRTHYIDSDGNYVVLDERYIPENIARIENVNMLINYAELVAVDDGDGNISFHRLNQPPNVLSAEFVESSIKRNTYATMTVRTFESVESLVVHNSSGAKENISIENVETAGSEKVWTIKFRIVAVGTKTFTVTGYNVNGLSGATKDATIQVTIK